MTRPVVFIGGHGNSGSFQAVWDVETQRPFEEGEYELINYDNIQADTKCPICNSNFAEDTNYCEVCDIDWNNVDNDQVVEVLHEIWAQQESA